MIMSICFNPSEMDYTSWLTVSGFTMTILLFFMNRIMEIMDNFSVDTAEETMGYYSFIGFFFSFLIILSIGGILCFIFSIENIGAVFITIVLFILPILTPLLFLRKRKTVKEKNKIDEKVAEFQPNIPI